MIMDESPVAPKLTIRRSFEIKEKRNAVAMIYELVSSGCSQHKGCTAGGIPYLYYCCWKKLIKKVDNINDGKKFLSFNTKGTSRRIYQGHPSLLNGIEPQLKTFMFHVRKQCIRVTNRMVVREAARLLPSFAQKPMHSKIVSIHRFTRSLGLTQHAATHTAQKHFMETAADAKDFIIMVKQKLEGRNRDDILNTDQTPIPFSYHLNKTLEVKGTKTIHAKASTINTKQVTLAATVTASGKMLPPFLIFKGKPNGWIAMWEFLTFPASGRYACQEKAWMDEKRMQEWVDVVLKPWKEA